jgi:hypothetical protein
MGACCRHGRYGKCIQNSNWEEYCFSGLFVDGKVILKHVLKGRVWLWCGFIWLAFIGWHKWSVMKFDPSAQPCKPIHSSQTKTIHPIVWAAEVTQVTNCIIMGKWKWLFISGYKFKSQACTAAVFLCLCKHETCHQCVQRLWQKIMIREWNKWAVLNVAITYMDMSHVIWLWLEYFILYFIIC